MKQLSLSLSLLALILSTRPGSKEIRANEEINRIIPIISQIRKKYKKEFISVDTRKSQVMKEACKFDINLINDVSGLRFDKNSKKFLNSNNIPFVLMHSISTPEKMQKTIKYKDVLLDIYDFFEKQISLCEKNGISKSRIIIDPGIGFGKTLQQNLKLRPTGADLPLLGTDGPALLISSSGLDLSILPSFNNVVISSPFKVSYSIKPFARACKSSIFSFKIFFAIS